MLVAANQFNDNRRGSESVPVTQKEWTSPKASFNCEVAIIPEENGYSVVSTKIPGIVSHGDTRDEAIANITEALTGALSEYISSNAVIPSNPSWYEFPPNLEKIRVRIDV